MMSGLEIGVSIAVGGAIVWAGCYLTSEDIRPYKFSDFNYNIRHILQHRGIITTDIGYIKARARANTKLAKRREDSEIRGYINVMANRAFEGLTSNVIMEYEYKYVNRIVDALNHNGFIAWFEESEGNERFTNVKGHIIVEIPKED